MPTTPKDPKGLLNAPLDTPLEMTLDQLADILSLTIKHDKENKIVTFLGMLSAYTHDSQINISLNAQSSSGKTYIASEIAKLFPTEDKLELSGASPTSLMYGDSEFDEDRSARIIDLSRRILIFYEQPDSALQAKLRAIMSHDSWEQRYRITNKGKRGENKAELIIFQGFPATVFCSAGLRLDEQESTRAILLSPEVTQNKLSEGIRMQALRSANTMGFDQEVESNSKRIQLKERIMAIRNMWVVDIVISDPKSIEDRFRRLLGNNMQPRHMRDIGHLMKIIKAITLFNVWYRMSDNGDVVATQSDIDQAFGLWEYFVESLQLGISPGLLSFYRDFILPAYYEKRDHPDNQYFKDEAPIGISRQELNSYYLKVTEKPMNEDYLRKQIIPQLANCGLIHEEKPLHGDARSRHIYPQMFVKSDEEPENNIGSGGGVPENPVMNVDFFNEIFPDKTPTTSI